MERVQDRRLYLKTTIPTISTCLEYNMITSKVGVLMNYKVIITNHWVQFHTECGTVPRPNLSCTRFKDDNDTCWFIDFTFSRYLRSEKNYP